MATGDILSAVVRADGWSMDVTIEGFAVGATYDFGSLDDTPATVTAPMFSVSVVSEGYNAAGVLGTVSRTVYGTHVVRKPYPDQASKDETASGSDLVVRVALSESIYNDDKNGGAGTSGTDPAITIAAGWATNTGGAAQTSAVATALACTNNSTLDYPKCIAQWAWGHTPFFKRVTTDFTIGASAYHGFGIAAVFLSAIGVGSSNTVSGTKTVKTDHASANTGLHYESYDLAVPVSGYTEGENITLKFIAYPTVGDADSIVDTSAQTAILNSPNGNAQITCTYKTTGLVTKYVATAGSTPAGSDANAGTEAAPYLTIGKALDVDADVIYVRAGTYDINGSTPASVTARDYFVEVKPYTGESVTLNRGGSFQYNVATKTEYSDFTITCDSVSGWLRGTQNRIIKFNNCVFSNSANPSAGLGYQSIGVWFIECDLASSEYLTQQNGGAMYNYIGCNFAGVFFTTVWRAMIACKHPGHTTGCSVSTSTATSTQGPENILMLNNEFLAFTLPSSNLINQQYASVVGGCAYIGNLVEIKTSSTGKAMNIYGDANTSANNNTIIAHNTVVGWRTNLFYNDTGVASVLSTNCFVKNNAFSCFNIKTDTYGTPNANRIGNWEPVNGVNCSDNIYDMVSAVVDLPDWKGINCRYYTAIATEGASSDFGFTDDNCYWGDGTGNGDYMPTEGSVLYDQALRQAYQNYDLYGVAL